MPIQGNNVTDISSGNYKFNIPQAPPSEGREIKEKTASVFAEDRVTLSKKEAREEQ